MKRPVDEQILYELENSYGDWFKGKFESPQMTNELYPYENLFRPIKINGITVKNRIVMGPMGNINMSEETGRPSQKMIDYFEARAKGGVGLITTGLVPVSFGIDPSIIELGKLSYFPRIDRSRTVCVGWRNIASVVHTHGAKIFIQLSAGLGRVGNPQCLLNQFALPVSASWNPNYYIPQIPCRPLSGRAVRRLVGRFGQASADAKAAGLDGVYLHGHEGYLLEQFSNPAFNRRLFGRYANWQQFGLDIVREIRDRVGPKYPIMYRIDLSLALNATYGEKMKEVKSLKKFMKERTIEQSLDYMLHLVKAGVDIFDVDLGCYDNWWLPHPPSSMPSGCFLDISQQVKDYFEEQKVLSNAGLPVPIVAVGKLGYPDLAEKALSQKKCDMVMLARPLLADPDWVNKVYANQVEQIVPCIGCQEACIREFVEGGHPQCSVNPRTGFEDSIPQELNQSQKPQRIAVIGAGPAGIMTAQTLLSRGHTVELYEKWDRVGGLLHAASVPAIKYELANYAQYLENLVRELQKNDRFQLMLNSEKTAEELKSQQFDVIVVATGTRSIPVSIPSSIPTSTSGSILGSTPVLEKDRIFELVQVLENPGLIESAKNITILGGGDAGCETAYWLAYELGKKVTIVEVAPTLMTHSCTANRGHVLHYLQKVGVLVHNHSTVRCLTEKGLIIEKNMSKTVPDPYNTWSPILPENIKNPLARKILSEIRELEIPSDAVIVAYNRSADSALYEELVESHAAPLIFNVGDSNIRGKVFSATKTAFRKARTI
ncbi:MAG: FAD-dependent oxidoreductase [Thermoguttaceae bacterium]